MFTTSFVRRSLFALALIAPITAQSQEIPIFSWSGRVDREVRLTIQGSRMSNSSEPNMQTRGRFFETHAMPAEDGTIRIAASSGRGQMVVLQQPNSSNGYTAIISLQDNDGGADNYRLTAYFTPNARAYGNRDAERGRDRDRNRDGIPDRQERRGVVRGPMLSWSGDVDGEVDLVWRSNGVNQKVMSGGAPRVQNSRVTGEVSATQYGQLSVAVREGRGRVDVVQQPSAQNRYTGIIRIVDPQAGYGHYVLEATWQ